MSSSLTKIDGRRLRSERTKQLIIEAYLVLAEDLSPRVPRAAEIAEKAGYRLVGHRLELFGVPLDGKTDRQK